MKYDLFPCNRYLTIKPYENKKEDGQILLPDDYKNKDTYKVMEVVDTGKTNILSNTFAALRKGGPKLIVVPSNVIEKIVLFGEEYYVILDQYVVGELSLKEEE